MTDYTSFLVLVFSIMFATNVAAYYKNDSPFLKISKFVSEMNAVDFNSGNCRCANYKCECCVPMDDIDNVNGDACVTMTLVLSDPVGVKVDFEIGDFQTTVDVSISSPSGLCVKYANELDACLRFRELSISLRELKGCVSLEMTTTSGLISQELGCFQF